MRPDIKNISAILYTVSNYVYNTMSFFKPGGLFRQVFP